MTTDKALDLALEALEALELSSVTVDSFGVQRKTQEAITAIKQARSAPVQEPTCKQSLQVWVISNGKGAGQFSWDPQDERFWTRMEPAAQPAPVQSCYCPNCEAMGKELAALKAQPAPVQEPVAWMYESVCGNDFATRHTTPDYAKNIRPLYTTPPAAQPAVPLTDEQKLMCWSRATHDADVEHKTEHQCLMDYGSEIESAHGIAAAPEKGQP